MADPRQRAKQMLRTILKNSQVLDETHLELSGHSIWATGVNCDGKRFTNGIRPANAGTYLVEYVNSDHRGKRRQFNDMDEAVTFFMKETERRLLEGQK